MKIVIIGGHFTPALAVIEQLPDTAEVLYVGRKYTFEKDKSLSLEYRAITERDIPFVSLTTGRLQRSFSRQTLPSLAKIPKGVIQAYSILSDFKPDLVIGFGGYLSLPVCLSAAVLRIPFVIHEQTLHAGMANKFLGRFATKVCVSWESSAKFFPKDKTILTGNPLPQSMFTNSNMHIDSRSKSGMTQKDGTPTICIIGGSAGSHALNVLVEGCLPQLLEHYTVIHQTGDAQEFKDFDRLESLRKSLPPALRERYFVNKFIEPTAFFSILQKADVVVSRSGINTVTTILFLQKPSLLIPLPVGQRNEQHANAMLLQQAGLGEIVLQQDLTPQKLFDKIVGIVNNRKKYQYVEEKAKKVDPLRAAEKIVTVLNDISQRQTQTQEKSTH